jgi:hypothetical protein
MAGSGVPVEGGVVIALRRPRPARGLLRAAGRQVPRGRLDDRMCEFIGRQHTMFLTGEGGLGGALRAGPAGFVQVLDTRWLVWPERDPDALLAELCDTRAVRLLFIDLFHDQLRLRVRGQLEVRPGFVSVLVEEAYIQRISSMRRPLVLVPDES